MADDPFILRLQQGEFPLSCRKMACPSVHFSPAWDPAVVALLRRSGTRFSRLCCISIAGKEMLAVTMQSDLDPPEQLAAARHFAGEAGFPHRILSFHALDYPAIRLNPSDRC